MNKASNGITNEVREKYQVKSCQFLPVTSTGIFQSKLELAKPWKYFEIKDFATKQPFDLSWM